MTSATSLAVAIFSACYVGLTLSADFTLANAKADKTCPDTWQGPNLGVCYKLVKDKTLSWYDAVNEGCKAENANARLATVTLDNKAFLSKQPEIFMTNYYWIGFRSSDYIWSSATPPYSNWEEVRHVEPTGSKVLNNDCVMIIGTQAGEESNYPGYWLDWDCKYDASALCQLKATGGKCPDEWTKQNGVCYRLNTKRSGWDTASAGCADLHSDAELATVPFTFEDMVDSGIYETDNFWVNLRTSDVDAEGKLHWGDGEGAEVTSADWLTLDYYEPNGVSFFENVCVMVHGVEADEPFSTGTWADTDCSYDLGFLCELDLN